MIDQPGLELRVHAAESLEIVGPMPNRVRRAVQHWLESSPDLHHIHCLIELVSVPRLHAGLGVGTQLALSVATGLNVFYNRTTPSTEQLAKSAGRGLRSAVGTYGFVLGGLIAEQGKLPTETISPLIERVELPRHWRFVLMAPSGTVGLYGPREQSAFDALPPVPAPTTRRLTEILCERMLPAAAAANFSDFSEAVYEFGFLAGSCFESVQGSAYNGAVLESLVRQIHALGVRGVGQSSWGPTVFSVCESESSALALVDDLRRTDSNELEILISAPNNCGARVRVDAVDP